MNTPLEGAVSPLWPGLIEAYRHRLPVTDSTPVVRNKDKFKDNMELSIARSRAVYDFMMREGGISANKMYTAGYGEYSPIIHPEKTASDRAKNRRVEISILPTNVKIEKEKMAEASQIKKK